MHVYVIKSKISHRIYVGSTGDLTSRIKAHNHGECAHTKVFKPWRLIYQEKYDSVDLARARERFLKTGRGRAILKQKLISNPK